MISHRNWVQTASGEAVDLLDPKPETIHGGDIATALSRIVRFNGHTKVPYTVAQHSVLVTDILVIHGEWSTLLWDAALLHDAHEAFMGDIVNPVIWLPGVNEAVVALKDRLQRAIHARYHMPLVLPPEAAAAVDHADRLACAIEKRDLLEDSPYPWHGLPSIPAAFSREAGYDVAAMAVSGRLDTFGDRLRDITPPWP